MVGTVQILASLRKTIAKISRNILAYARFEALQRKPEPAEILEEYLENEAMSLKRELLYAYEVKLVESVPLMIGHLLEMVYAKVFACSDCYFCALSTVKHELVTPGASVPLCRQSNALVDILRLEVDSTIAEMTAYGKPGCLVRADTDGL